MSGKEKIMLYEKLNTFIKKYYINQLIKGAIYLITTLTVFFIVFSVVEFFSEFNVQNRTVLFWGYIIINSIIASKYVLVPLLNLFNLKKGLTYKNAAKIIGRHFSEIDDKLLNLLELKEIGEHENALINASIKQKMDKIQPLTFTKAINLYENKKHLKWIAVPISMITILIASNTEYIITESSARIIKHNTFFEPRAPFDYLIINNRLEVIQYEDFTLKVKINGYQIPSEVFLVIRSVDKLLSS